MTPEQEQYVSHLADEQLDRASLNDLRVIRDILALAAERAGECLIAYEEAESPEDRRAAVRASVRQVVVTIEALRTGHAR